MKVIKAIARLLFIACIWSIGYVFWYRQLLMKLWAFDPIMVKHWRYVVNIWQRGWVIQKPSEWAFVILLFAFIPMWFIGWALLSSISWCGLIKFILLLPLKLFKNSSKEKKPIKKLKISKKKSYKKVRPPAIRMATGKVKPLAKEPAKEPAVAQPQEHSAPTQSYEAPAAAAPQTRSTGPPSPAPAQQTAAVSGNSVSDVLRSAGYRLIQNVSVGTQKIDFVGVAANKLLLCLVDSESGDWLADEERFNDEEPLWFSESNHRVSPVRLTLNARDALSPKLTGRLHDLKIEPMVVISKGTIINAEDMLDVWSNLHITVCRFESGAPNEIKSLTESVSPVSGADDSLFNDVSAVLR